MYDLDGIGYFRIARDAAQKSRNPEYRVGATVCRRKPISIGFNQYFKSHPSVPEVQHLRGRSRRLHAEMHAMVGLSLEEGQGSTVYVIRLTPGNRIALAKPCELCTGFLIGRGVKKVFYSIEGEEYGVLKL